MSKIPPGIVVPSEDEFRCDVRVLNALKEIMNKHDVDLIRESGESVTAFARRIVEVLTGKFIDIDRSIAIIEAILPGTVQDA